MSLSNLVDALEAVSSSNAGNQLKDIEAHLASLALQPTFYIQLAEIGVCVQVTNTARLQALLYLKNSVDSVWRTDRRRPTGVDLNFEEKHSVRSLLLTHSDDHDENLALQKAVLIAKIARYDCPQAWPELIPTLTERIGNSGHNSVQHVRSLLTLSHITKSLASKRLAFDKRNFVQLTKYMFVPLNTLWSSHLQNFPLGVCWFSAVSVHLCAKILRYLFLHGFPEMKNSPNLIDENIKSFIPSLPEKFFLILNTGQADGIDGINSKVLFKAASQILKLLLDFQNFYPEYCAHWLSLLLRMTFDCSLSDQPTDRRLALPARMRAQCFNFINNVLLCPKYKKLKVAGIESEIDPIAHLASIAISEFSTDERLRLICRRLVGLYMMWSEEEIELWSTEPETFATEFVEEVNEHCWQYSLRPAASVLYSTVMHEHWSVLAPVVCEWLNLLTKPTDLNNINSILERDAVLAALGLAADDLYDTVDFSLVFSHSVLDQSLWFTFSTRSRILQRRMLWLCGKWIGVKFDRTLRFKLFELLAKALSNQYDIVVRLTAANVIRTAVDDFEFSVDQCLHQIGLIVHWLVDILQSCEEDDCRMCVVNCLVLISERLGVELKPHLHPVIAVLPQLWNSEHNLIKSQLLALLTNLVNGLGCGWLDLLDGLCQILTTALDSSQSSHVYLLEDGLTLWLAVTQNHPSPVSSHILQLFMYMPDLLTIQSENLKICVEILRSYVAFESTEFTQYLGVISNVYGLIIDDLKSEAVILLLKALSFIITVYGINSVQCFCETILWCLRYVTGKTKVFQESFGTLSACYAVLSRMCLVDPCLFIGLISDPTKINMTSNVFVENWLNDIRRMSHDMIGRKLNCLALTSVLATGNNVFVSLLPDVLSTVVEVLFDICCVELNGDISDRLTIENVRNLSDDAKNTEEIQHELRIRALRAKDPIFCTKLNEIVGSATKQCCQVLGLSVPDMVQNIDVEVLATLQRFRCL